MLETGAGTHTQAQAKIHAQAQAVNRKHTTHILKHTQSQSQAHSSSPGTLAQIVIIYDELELLWQLTW